MPKIRKALIFKIHRIFYKEDNVEASLNIILSNNFGTDDLSKILEKYNDEGQE